MEFIMYVSFYAKSLNKPLNYFIRGSRLISTLESSFLKSFGSSLKSHPLWVTLYEYDFSRIDKPRDNLEVITIISEDPNPFNIQAEDENTEFEEDNLDSKR